VKSTLSDASGNSRPKQNYYKLLYFIILHLHTELQQYGAGLEGTGVKGLRYSLEALLREALELGGGSW